MGNDDAGSIILSLSVGFRVNTKVTAVMAESRSRRSKSSNGVDPQHQANSPFLLLSSSSSLGSDTRLRFPLVLSNAN